MSAWSDETNTLNGFYDVIVPTDSFRTTFVHSSQVIPDSPKEGLCKGSHAHHISVRSRPTWSVAEKAETPVNPSPRHSLGQNFYRSHLGRTVSARYKEEKTLPVCHVTPVDTDNNQLQQNICSLSTHLSKKSLPLAPTVTAPADERSTIYLAPLNSSICEIPSLVPHRGKKNDVRDNRKEPSGVRKCKTMVRQESHDRQRLTRKDGKIPLGDDNILSSSCVLHERTKEASRVRKSLYSTNQHVSVYTRYKRKNLGMLQNSKLYNSNKELGWEMPQERTVPKRHLPVLPGSLTSQQYVKTWLLHGSVPKRNPHIAGTDEKVIIDEISSHCNAERQMIKQTYKTMYGRDLVDDLQDELSGHFETLCLYLLMPSRVFEAHCLRAAMKGVGTNESTLIDILVRSSSLELGEIKENYKNSYGSDLETDIRAETSGDLQKVLVSLLQGNRSKEPEIKIEHVQRDAADLYNAGVGNRIGTDESVFNKILVSRSIGHLHAVFEEYAKYDDKGIEGAIVAETSGDLQEVFLATARHVRNPLEYFADCFKECFKGALTKDEKLMQLVVGHAEVDLKDIKKAYFDKYDQSLEAAIQSETSGDYKNFLHRIIVG